MVGSARRESARAVSRRAVAELSEVASAVDFLCGECEPSMELFEASRAVHHALIALGDWCASSDDDQRPVRAAACT